MKLKELLKSIDARRPSALDEETKILFINSIIKRHGAIIGKNAVCEVELEDGVKDYHLPEGAEGDSIKAVMIDDERLMPVRYANVLEGQYAMERDGYITICGKEGQRCKIHYNACKPFDIYDDKGEYLEQECEAYESLCDIIVYGALYQICEAEEDIGAAANFKRRMDEALIKCRQSIYGKRGSYPKVRGVEGKWHRF